MPGLPAIPDPAALASLALAQASTPAPRTGLAVLFTLLGLGIALIIGATLVVLAVRRNILARDSALAGQNRLLDDLRALRDRGEISPEEFDRARQTLAARLAGSTAAPPRPARPATAIGPGPLRARPGFDLTGAPLPSPPTEPAASEQPPSPGNPPAGPTTDRPPDTGPHAAPDGPAAQ